MRLLIVASVLSLVALSRYANAAAAAVGYPYRTDLLAYGPSSGKFSNVVGNSLAHAHGYVRYLDQQGVQHIIGYKYPEPVQQSRRITNEEYLKQLVKGSLNKDEPERNKARDEHFRLWSMNQYDQYRQEIEGLKAAGHEPTADLLAKVKAYEDIVVAARRGEASSDTVDTTQIKQVRDEHLRLWNAQTALLRSGQMLEQQQPIGAQVAGAAPASTAAIHLHLKSTHADVKTHAVPTLAQAAIIGETAEQNKAREEHLRNYQEQLQRLQQAHAEAAKAAEASSRADAQPAKDARAQYTAQSVEQQKHVKPGHEMHIVEHFSYVQETPEVQRAKAEHLRLWQEAKQRAEKEAENENKVNSNEDATHQHAEGHFETKSIAQTGYTSQAKQAQQQQGLHFAQKDSSKYAEGQKQLELTDRSDTVTVFSDAQNNQKYQEKFYGQQQQTYAAPIEQNLPASNPQLPTPVQDTPEVQRARADHLRILEELQKQAEFNAEKLRDGIKTSADAAVQSPALTQTHHTPTAATSEQGATKILTGSGQQDSQVYTSVDAGHHSQASAVAVQDTIEVQRAREEHLKLLKEAFTKASEYQAANAPQASANTNEPYSAPYSSPTTDKLAEPLNNNESEDEARLRIDEVKQREAERLAEVERLKEEARLQAEELKRLQLEEQRRQEQERLEQTVEKQKDDAHYAERPQLPAVEEQPKQALNQLSQAQMGTERAVVNSQMLRFGGNQPGADIPTTAYYIGAQQPIGQQAQLAQLQNPGYYYLRDVTNGYLNVDKPYFLQYIPNQQQLGSKDAYAPADAVPLTSALAALNQIQNYEKPIEKPIIPLASAASPFSAIPAPIAQATATAFAPTGAPITAGSALFAPARAPNVADPFAAIAPSASLASIASFSPSSESMKIDFVSNPGLAALEQATREHFRAHEIALEQLRLANQKQPVRKDCY